jgi:penicillin-binding protein 1A
VAKRYLVLISRICAALVGVIALIAFANVCAYVYLKPALPDVGSLRDVQLQVPLRVYTRDGRLIAAIGDQRRIPVRYEQLPKKLVQAFLATEDDRFFQHHGVDWQGILRAAVANFKAGRISQGASTITMQVSRDMFLTPHRDMKRKMSEVYISLLMESEFTKEEIFSLYVNKIFLGQRAYGVAAAAEVYFGKTLDQLTIAEMATLAGIPTAPSVVNPVASAEASRVRRTHVLGRMRELGYITDAEYQTANNSPVESRLHGPTIEVDAPYVAEMVRNDMQAKYGDTTYTAGLPGLHHPRLAAGRLGHRGAAHRSSAIRPAARLARRDRQGGSVEGARRRRFATTARGIPHHRRPAAGRRGECGSQERQGLRPGIGLRNAALGKALLGAPRIAGGTGGPHADGGH